MFYVGKGKCSGCNFSGCTTYWMAESKEKAIEELKELHGDEYEFRKGLCGSCMADLLAKGDYIILNEGGDYDKINNKVLSYEVW